MAKGNDQSQQYKELRARVEPQIRDNMANLPNMGHEKLIQKLEIHQVELQMQNEELRKAQLELEAAKTKYFELYDLAPVGYFTLDDKGIVKQLNRTGAKLFGLAPHLLIGRNLTLAVSKEYRDEFYLHRKAVLETGVKQSCELRLIREDGIEFHAQMISSPAADEAGDVNYLRTAIIDISEQYQTKAELRVSEEHFRDIFENSVIGIYQTTPDGRILMANRALVKMLGYTSFEELAQRNLEQEGFEPDYSRLMFKQKIKAEGRVLGLESRWLRKDGSVLFVRESARMIRDDLDNMLYYEGTVEDITERKKAETALRESEMKFKTTIEGSHAAICLVDLNGVPVIVNKAYEEMMGYSSEELLEMDFTKYTHPDDLEKEYLLYKELVDGKRDSYTIEKRNIRKDGRHIWLSVNITAVRNNHSEINYLVAVGEDITDRKMAEDRLKEAKEFQDALLNLLPELVTYIDKNHTFKFANKQYKEFFNLDPQSMIGLHPRQVLGEKSYQKIAPRHKAALAGEQQVYETSFHLPNGELHHFHANYLPDISENGVEGFLAVVQDITERKRTEEAYRSLVDHSLQGLAIFQDKHVVFANQALAEISGYKVDEILAMSPDEIREFVHPEDREFVWRRHEQRLKEELPPERYQFRAIHKDGSVRWLEIGANLVEYQGKPAIQAAYLDITKRKKAEIALRNAEELFSKAFHASPDAMTISRMADGMILKVNDMWEELFGYSRSESIGKTSVELGIFCDPTIRQKAVQILRETGSLRNFEADIRRKTDEVRQVLLSGERLEVKGEENFITIIHDITNRKQAQDKLQQEAQMRRNLIDNLPCVALILKKNTREIVASNEKARKIGAVPGKTCYEVCAKRDEHCPFCLAPEVWDTNEPRRQEIEHNGKYYEGIWVPLTDNLYVHYIFDITERKKVAVTLQESEKKFRNLFNNAEVGMFRSRLDGSEFLESNNKYLSILGRTREEVIGKPTKILWADPKDREEMVNILKKQGFVNSLECRMLDKAGEVINCLTSLRLYPETGILEGSIVDITERKKAEAALVLRDRAINTSNQGISITDPRQQDNPLIYVNCGFEAITRYERSEVLGRNMRFLQGPDTDEKSLSRLNQAIEDAKECTVELINYRKDGSTFWDRVDLTPVLDDSGSLSHFIAIHTDVSSEKEAEKQLIEYHDKLKDMASRILHAEDDERRRIAVGIHDNICQKLVISKMAIDSALQLIPDNNVASSLKIVSQSIRDTIEEADSLTFDLSSPILHELGLIAAIKEYLIREINNKHKIAYELVSDDRLSDLTEQAKNLLFRISRELLMNVVKHARANKVKVSVQTSDGSLCLSVEDNGVGFPQPATSNNARFGLFSVREQLVPFGGRLDIESKPGHGATATVFMSLENTTK